MIKYSNITPKILFKLVPLRRYADTCNEVETAPCDGDGGQPALYG